ncbi:MAG: hypothetical protein MUC79_09925 [Thiobacillaceae bacterium]|jgi:hypothetical protein|nr:hypothetical protein [Thiobacillaceae bacterium]
MNIGADIQVSHFVPGRVRLRVAAIKGNPRLAERIRSAFRDVPGLTGLSYNTTTGSVLITYDARLIIAEDGGQRLRSVLREHLPGLDADWVIRWLGGPGSS